MEHLFFNSAEDIGRVADSICRLLGSRQDSGESKNVLNELYFEVVLLGIKVRIEENCYDYEDQYRYMVSMKRDVVSGSKVRDCDITSLARIIQHLLVDNLGLEAVLEVDSSLEAFGPSQ